MKIDEAIKDISKLAECVPNDKCIYNIKDVQDRELLEYNINMYDLCSLIENKVILENCVCNDVERIKKRIPSIINDLLDYYKLVSEYERLTSEKNIKIIASYNKVRHFLRTYSFMTKDAVISKIIDIHIDRLLNEILTDFFEMPDGFYDGCNFLKHLLSSINISHGEKYSGKLINFFHDVQKLNLNLECNKEILDLINTSNCLNSNDKAELLKIKKAYDVLDTLNT